MSLWNNYLPLKRKSKRDYSGAIISCGSLPLAGFYGLILLGLGLTIFKLFKTFDWLDFTLFLDYLATVIYLLWQIKHVRAGKNSNLSKIASMANQLSKFISSNL